MTHYAKQTAAGPATSPIDGILAELHERFGPLLDGHLADYIPELAKADPNHFGIVIVTADGGLYAIGNSETPFTIQSISKAFVYGLALEDCGRDAVLSKVGVEPSGDAFNSIIFDEKANRPFNPMVNAGAIATTALIKGEGGLHRLERILDMFRRYTGRSLPVDHKVFLSEKATGHRNRAIAHLELNFGMIDERVDEHLDLYFQQCSILVTCRDLAVMAATLANGGVNPLTGERAIAQDYVKNVVAVMNSCGMYDYSGEWGYRIGLPAKSGVGGGIIAVLPGRMGIGVFSPPLDARGNSVRGIKVCEHLSERFGINMFDVRPSRLSAVRRQYDGVSVGSKRIRNEKERQALANCQGRVTVFEIQGDLRFTTVEQLVRQVSALPTCVSHLILDCRRIGQVEASGGDLILALAQRQRDAGRQVRLAHLWPGRDAFERLRSAGIDGNLMLPDVDHALEWAERELLAEAEAEAGHDLVPLTQMDLFSGLDASALALLSPILEESRHPAGSVIFHEGEPATQVHLLSCGVVGVHVGLDQDRSRRLATLSPGLCFGEMALLDGLPRSAEVRAETDVVIQSLDIAKLHALSAGHPEIHAAILMNLARELTRRLRAANEEIRTWE
ncbi:MAG TPA: glutaminase A [Candidatus Sulfotelmatobacter sp.]|jgi:glutaminase|nr:glutaminase A [Candidatus Sulfotelmatobacter sp.]